MREEVFTSELFYKKLKRGFIDLNIFEQNCLENCLLSHIAFGILMEESKQNCIIALKKIREEYNNVENMTKSLLERYGIFPLNYLKNIGIFKTLEHISRKIQRKIICFSRHDSESDVDNTFETKIFERKKSLAIYLMLENNENSLEKTHITFINEVNLMTKKKLQYCKICEKSFSQSFFIFHKCYKFRCRKCPLLLRDKGDENFSIDGSPFCERNFLKDIDVKCTKCEQNFSNSFCYERHKISNSFCKKYSECKNCKIIFHGYHDCNKKIKFCRNCLKIHDISKSCKIEKSCLQNKIKRFENILFFQLILVDSKPIISFLNNFNSEESIMVNAWNKNERHLINFQKIKSNILSFHNNNLNFDEHGGNFSFENIIGPILVHLEKINKLKIICEKRTYNYLLENFGASEIVVNEKYGIFSSFKFKKILFQSMDSFLDINESILSIFLEQNSCSVIMPERIENINCLNINEKKIISENDFNFDHIFGNDPMHFLTFKKDRNDFLKIFSEKNVFDRDLFFFISLCKHEIWIKALLEMSKLFSNVCTDLGENDPKSLWTFQSLTSAGFNLLISQIDENVPVISSRPLQFHKNSSKQEIILSQLLILVHKEFCQNVPQSVISHDGKQFFSKNLSSDIACSKCNFHYFIEGTFKVKNCKYHGKFKKNNFFHQNFELLAQEAQNKRELFKKDNPNVILRVINGCCFNDKKNDAIIEELNFFCKSKEEISKYLKIYEDLKENFSKEEFLPLSCQSAIQNPLVESFSQFSEIDDDHLINKIMRFDLNNAYASCIQDENFTLPVGEPLKLMQKEATIFCEKNILNVPIENVKFAAIKILVTPNNKNEESFIPFFNYKNAEISFLTLCKRCADESIKSKKNEDCEHEEKFRRFYTTCLSEDLWTAVNVLKYSVKICEVLYFEERKHFSGLAKISKILSAYKICSKLNFSENCVENLRNVHKNNFISKKHFEFSNLTSFLTKKMLVSSLGRFALNCSKYENSKIFTNSLSLLSACSLGKINSFNFFGNDQDNKCLALLPKMSTNFTFSKSTRSNTNCLIFAHILNSVRRKIFFDCISVNSSKNLNLERADCDSITFSLKEDGEKECQNIFQKSGENLSYKLELDDILGIYNLKRRSYILRRKDFNIFKTCGLRLTIRNRFFGEITNINCDPHKLRRKFKKGKINKDLKRIKTYPFGFKHKD